MNNKDNDFKKDLQVLTDSWSKFSQEEAKKLYLDKFQKDIEKYMYSSPEKRKYFHMMISAIMLEYHKNFHGYKAEINYRFKSKKSIIDKEKNRLNSADLTIDKKNRISLQAKDITDAFAMKVISITSPSTYHVNDPEINKLVEEKNHNQKILAKMQEFKNKLTENDFTMNQNYIYEVEKKEYYNKCIELIDAITSMISPEATILKEKYAKQRDNFEKTIEYLDQIYNEHEIVDEADYPLEYNDFFYLLDDFSSRIYDKLDLALLTKQLESMFKQSEVLKEMGVSIHNTKCKRASSGYVSNFIYLSTPFGIIELQAQTEHEFAEGNHGYSAHSSNMKGKELKPLRIPSLENINEVKKFQQNVKFISPRAYVARMDDVEENKVVINAYSAYKNYRNIIGQVDKTNQSHYLNKYFDTLYEAKETLFENNASVHEITSTSLKKYVSQLDIKNLSKQKSTEDR